MSAGEARVEQEPPARIWAAHLLFFLHLVTFLVVVVGQGATWHCDLIETLGLGDAQDLLRRPWTLISYAFLDRHYLEFILADLGILLLAGGPLEARLGSQTFLAFYLAAAVLTGLARVSLVEAGLLDGGVLGGGMGASAAILTGYLFLLGHERLGRVPYPILYVMAAAALLALTTTLAADTRHALLAKAATARDEAYKGEDLSVDERVALLGQVQREERLRPDHQGHLLGLPAGALALLLCLGGRRGWSRYRVHQGIRGLQAEVEARARVEELLEKISRSGLESLSPRERKFLRYASRYYRPRQPA